MKTRVLLLLPYPLHSAPSQRFRVEAFFELLQRNSIDYHANTFLDESAWKILYQRGSLLQKGWAVVKGFLKRFFVVLCHAWKYDYVFVHREAAPLGPPIFEWVLAKVLRKKMIYDYDDAIWIPNLTQSNKLARWVKCFWKVKSICKWSYKISAGNDYLADFARGFNVNVEIVPTCVDTVKRYNRIKMQNASKLAIGWTGSHSTLKYLLDFLPVVERLEKQYDFDFLVICDKNPEFALKSFRFIPWNEATEIEDLLQINIGVMPLVHDAWSEGKCGFKIIQYLSLGIPAVASPVGVNKSIVRHEKNGFLCHSESEWYTALEQLVNDELLRTKFGKDGKRTVEEYYSVKANSKKYLSLFS